MHLFTRREIMFPAMNQTAIASKYNHNGDEDQEGVVDVEVLIMDPAKINFLLYLFHTMSDWERVAFERVRVYR